MSPVISGSGFIGARNSGARGANPFGSEGRIRLEAFNHAFTGGSFPRPHFSRPGLVFPPTAVPSVRVTNLAGINVPSNPTGSFDTPDVTINEAGEVLLAIEAQNIPLGTIVKLSLYSEAGPCPLVDSTPLDGTFEQSTATASIQIPHGFSRFFVMARWNP